MSSKSIALLVAFASVSSFAAINFNNAPKPQGYIDEDSYVKDYVDYCHQNRSSIFAHETRDASAAKYAPRARRLWQDYEKEERKRKSKQLKRNNRTVERKACNLPGDTANFALDSFMGFEFGEDIKKVIAQSKNVVSSYQWLGGCYNVTLRRNFRKFGTVTLIPAADGKLGAVKLVCESREFSTDELRREEHGKVRDLLGEKYGITFEEDMINGKTVFTNPNVTIEIWVESQPKWIILIVRNEKVIAEGMSRADVLKKQAQEKERVAPSEGADLL